MIQAIAEAVIYLATVFAIVGGIVFFAYVLSLVLRERHERRAFPDDSRRKNAARRAGRTPESKPAPLGRARSPVPYPNAARALRRHA